MRRIQILDSHTGGEPTRLVLDGGPDLGQGPLSERLRRLATDHDTLRTGVLAEPRGSAVLVGALLCAPTDPGCAAGVLFFNNTGYLGMCGHGTIGLVASLAYLGRLGPGVHRIETPVGPVQATLHDDGRVAVRNVPAYRYRRAVAIEVPGQGRVCGDIAWGGNWFFLVNEARQPLSAAHIPALQSTCLAIQQALADQGVRGADGALIDHIELFDASPTPGVDSRSFVLCPGGEYDRSPCGTGTSAKLACLAADGTLAAGQSWHQESIVGSVFEASYVPAAARPDGTPQIIPTITGRAHLSGEGTLLFEDDDPFAWGLPQG